jgi:hypothetical protein
LYGAGGIPEEAKHVVRWKKLPAWVKEDAQATIGHLMQRARGGFVSRVSGEFVATPFRLLGVSRSHVTFVDLRDVGAVVPSLDPVAPLVIPEVI